jgi:hypothetical protein
VESQENAHSGPAAIEEFSETGPAIARVAKVAPALVAKYTKLGVIECRKTSSGIALYQLSAAAKVRAFKKKRMAMRGRPKSKPVVAV